MYREERGKGDRGRRKGVREKVGSGRQWGRRQELICWEGGGEKRAERRGGYEVRERREIEKEKERGKRRKGREGGGCVGGRVTE